MLYEKNGILSQKEFIFRLEDKKLEEKGWVVKKGKGRSSYIEITVIVSGGGVGFPVSKNFMRLYLYKIAAISVFRHP